MGFRQACSSEVLGKLIPLRLLYRLELRGSSAGFVDFGSVGFENKRLRGGTELISSFHV